MWEERAYAARREIAGLAASGLGVSDLHAEAIRVIDRDVKTELTCWATLDPESLVISAMTSSEVRVPVEYEPLLANAELSPDETHSFAAMARRAELLTRFSDYPRNDRDRSRRYRNVWRPLGVEQEVRVLFTADGTTWGAAGLVRSGLVFSDREVEYLGAVAPAIGAATRLAVRSEISNRLATGQPAIVIVSDSGNIRSATGSAREWQERLNALEPGWFVAMMHVMVAGVRNTHAGVFRARIRDGRGQWALLQASALIGGGADAVAVSIDPAAGEQLTTLLFAAYGLSPRERDVCREVIAGHSTADIAGNLFVSQNTVQDHLKSAFAKVGVRSRGELVARLQPRPAERA
ncbi:LuxR family transcriptional regulator [Mycetocola manganoxydans]|uniref:LuxR family transcriptional regulator n=1 Tax=Mycetocola manganoxydans TaxID=699879 RepID=A0A3L6ZXI6_9MICO|nr:helix-turn-helix transcriptional regulator [Mycetocola manganoxydans]RLP72627.1 LuxR family transcriptional regulator [Mycetocola manganoxydans]